MAKTYYRVGNDWLGTDLVFYYFYSEVYIWVHNVYKIYFYE